MHPMDVIPASRTSSPYSLTEAISDLTTNAAGTDTQSLNQSLDTLSATIDQIAPQLGPTFDGLARLSRTINSRNESLRDLLNSAADVTGILSERSQQVNALILNANDLLAVLVERQDAIVSLLANTSAVSRQLIGLVHDNEQELAPTLERLNRVTAMLEKNRDNIAKALPGLAKFQITQGETVSNGFYYNAYVPNLQPAQLLQPFLDYAFGFRRGTDAGQPPDNAGPRAELPFPYNGIPPAYEREMFDLGMPGVGRTLMSRNRFLAGIAVVLIGLLVAAAIFVVRQTFFKPTTITAYFTATTAIYPGDEVRVAGVKVGTIASIEPVGTQAKMTMHVDRERAHPGRRESGDRRAEPGRSTLCPAHARISVNRAQDGRRCSHSARPDGGAGGVGRGQGSIDETDNGSGPQQRRFRHRRLPASSTVPPTRCRGTATN